MRASPSNNKMRVVRMKLKVAGFEALKKRPERVKDNCRVG